MYPKITKQYNKIQDRILGIYDNEGKTFDRYTVVYSDPERVDEAVTLYMSIGMSSNPTHPLGFCQHSAAMLGDHLGKQIPFGDLPLACQIMVLVDLGASLELQRK